MESMPRGILRGLEVPLILPGASGAGYNTRHGDEEDEPCSVRGKIPPGLVSEVSTKIEWGGALGRLREIFERIGEEFGFEIEAMEVGEEHVHFLISFPPRYSISKVVGILKSISASRMFREFGWLKEELWGGELWEDGYFARTVGNQVTAEIIKRYIERHRELERAPTQLDLELR